MTDPHLLLSQLRHQLTTIPPFCGFEEVPDQELEWLGKTHALIRRWNDFEGIAFQTAVDFLGMVPVAQQNINKIRAILHRAIADLEIDVQSVQAAGGAFGPGAVYDFFNELNKLIAQATTTLFIIDPYMDSDIFDQYLSSSNTHVDISLLVSSNSSNLKAAAQKFAQQKGGNIEVRKSSTFHDRLVILDSNSVWVLGQSIKDAAKKKPTYLAPLAPDVSSLKIQHYSNIWQQATAI